jgi:hypothetical protein
MAVFSVVDTATGSTNTTRSGLSFGADVPERIIVVALSWFITSAVANPTVTVGGVTATLAKSSVTTTNNTGAAIYYAQVTGTTGSVVVTFGGTVSQFQIATYRLEVASALAITPGDSNATPQAGSAAGATATISISVVPNGIVIATLRNSSSGTVTDSYSGTDTMSDDVNALNSVTHVKSHVQTTETATRSIGYTSSTSSVKFMAVARWTSSAALASGSGAALLCGV